METYQLPSGDLVRVANGELEQARGHLVTVWDQVGEIGTAYRRDLEEAGARVLMLNDFCIAVATCEAVTLTDGTDGTATCVNVSKDGRTQRIPAVRTTKGIVPVEIPVRVRAISGELERRIRNTLMDESAQVINKEEFSKAVSRRLGFTLADGTHGEATWKTIRSQRHPALKLSDRHGSEPISLPVAVQRTNRA